MIYSLRGKVLEKEEGFIVIETSGGIGFKIFSSKKTLEKMPSVGENVFLYAYLDVGEKKFSLYGFLTKNQLGLFSAIKKISGIGAKASLEISSFGSLENFKKEISERGSEALKEISGLGEKKAKKIILEILGQIDNKRNNNQTKDKVFIALKKMGFSKEEITEALEKIAAEASIGDDQERLKKALKIIGSNYNN